MERDDETVTTGGNGIISTHTLTWSVTSLRISSLRHSLISTHTLTWSVTTAYSVTEPTLQISTHTLTWSVTNKGWVEYVRFNISTHTLTWSVTCPICGKRTEYIDFNSHAHVERDGHRRGRGRSNRISTHTLTWSVTWLSSSVLPYSFISTHTLTWSVTLDVVYIWCLLNVMRTYCFI